VKLTFAAAMTAATALLLTPSAAQATPTTATQTTATQTTATQTTATQTTATQPTAIGIIGNYSDDDMRIMQGDGRAADALVELEWAYAEPVRGSFDEAYLGRIAERISTLRAMGYRIALNTGVQNAPEWLLRLPGARYVDQYGHAYRDSNEPNLVFGTGYRYLATRYLTTVFARLGTDFSIVRAGGGHWGELTYPSQVDPATGRLRNLYYAFDVNAKAKNPVPSWRPGRPSTAGQAGRFLSWYLNSLAGYQNWQIAALRQAGYAGRVAVLYPSWGMRAGDFERAVATNLAGSSSPEINGEVQRGYDAKRQIAALRDPNVVVYGTWAENADTVAYLAGLAAAKGLATMAETSHVCTPAQLPEVLRQSQAAGVQAVYVVRLPAADIVSSSHSFAAA
jgi:glycosyl hydrolase family 42 (putative beta-galactosidase)